MLAALMSSCSEPAPFRGSVRDLIPQQVGDFKLKGEIKSVSIAPLDKYQSGALRPTEGMIAQYEAPGGAQLSFQAVNYPSASDAAQALKQMEERCQKILSMIYLRDSAASYAEVAAAIGVGETSISPMRSRCLQKLAKILKS
jgi:DNA-directed RNA polymerase specialized sigma24 family protein